MTKPIKVTSPETIGWGRKDEGIVYEGQIPIETSWGGKDEIGVLFYGCEPDQCRISIKGSHSDPYEPEVYTDLTDKSIAQLIKALTDVQNFITQYKESLNG